MCSMMNTCIKTILQSLITKDDETADTKTQARTPRKNMEKLETVFFIIFWNDILMRINKTDKILQKESLSLSVAVKMFSSLILYIEVKRKNFDL